MDNKIFEKLFEEVTNLHSIPIGAYNIRLNSKAAGRNSSANIDIIPKTDKPGIDIIIKPNTKHESVHIPALVTETGIHDLVYNDFYIGENADVVIVAGCGIHNDGDSLSQHDGVHRFFVGKNARVLYIEKHIGTGDGKGERIINPQTIVEVDEGGYIELQTTQLKGVDSTLRTTKAKAKENGTVVVKEKILTHGTQYAETRFDIDLNGDGSSVNLVSRSVAKEKSRQKFVSVINGNAKCMGHSECDSIIMDEGVVSSLPEITANNVEATLVHEAAIGKIAGEQITKLMTLGLTEAEAEAQIVNGFLK
ncbi:MAG: SufD family Fe-S cluster assembly protein [Clostridia bacterium]|jgi:Fe-S cluster assembly scaffold protein SufB|nr:SufD family Fe-S cluster assembly protein [Clostridia bacterium]MCI1960154.1 SufD family Fe-S cluster assembly protein [Clostridia bacterium]MCI1998901.1 SufD family Fe-S cluster assembly protein [Clostridia bacterium]MCI2013651.1 SufD family Fe-S cluster assembly protein [Clostridia bacterium]